MRVIAKPLFPISKYLRVRPSSAWGTLALILVALIALTPELIFGLTVTDNFRFNLTWPEQFAALFRAGNPYPRWLPHCWDGMGSPVFYFYPPLFFWVTSLIDTATSGVLGSERLVPMASLALLIASGLSMRAWLRAQAGEGRALVGAMAFMAGPFHLYHFYGTGALAEASAYASIPIVMLALKRLGEGRITRVPLLGLSYAALLFAHLPTALLATLFLMAPYALFIAFRCTRPLRFLASAITAGIAGISLAAVFIVPALALLPQVSPHALNGTFYQPENWFFWHVRAGIMGGRMLLLIPIAMAAFLFAAASALAVRSRLNCPEILFWSALTAFLVALVAGLIPFVWKLPLLTLVQFPWRALSLVEFTTVTLLVVGAPPLKSPLMLAGTAALTFAYVALALIAAHTVGRTWTGQQQTAAQIRADYRDAPEYLPAGIRIEQGSGPDDVRLGLPRVPLARAADSRATVKAVDAPDGSMTVAVDSDWPTRIELHRFYFPHWRLSVVGRPVPLFAHPDDRTVIFQAPAGRTTFSLEPGLAPYELLGRMFSLLAAITLVALAVASRLARSRSIARILYLEERVAR